MERIPRGGWKDFEAHYLGVLDNPWYQALVEVQDALSVGTFEFFSSRRLRAMQLPITTHSISSPMGLGSDSLPVEIDLFGVKTYLADSMQFMLEYGVRLARSHGCYYLLPSFRGESADERHLCQFYHSEAEIPGQLDDVMALVEAYVRHLARKLLGECADTVKRFAGSLSHLESMAEHEGRFPRITMDEADRRLAGVPGAIEHRPEGFRNLTRRAEQELIAQMGGFVWVSHFDFLMVPFYQARTDDGRQALCADLLMGIGEVVGCGERHASGDEVRESLAAHRVDAAPYEWYITMKDRFPLRTSGFGLGLERFILWVFSHDDIRDCQLLPRFNGQRVIP